MDFFKQFDLIFFDFDGLLVNTEHLHYQAYQQLLQDYGYTLKWEYDAFSEIAHVSGTGIRNAIYQEYPKLKELHPQWEELYEIKKKHYTSYLEKGKLELMPGVSEVLDFLHEAGILHVVVTNSTRKQTKLIRHHLPKLQKIPGWITREDYESPKPAPDAYLAAKRYYGKEKDHIVGFEDTLKGISSLQQAAIKAILICSENHPQLQKDEAKKVEYYPSFLHLAKSYIQK